MLEDVTDFLSTNNIAAAGSPYTSAAMLRHIHRNAMTYDRRELSDNTNSLLTYMTQYIAENPSSPDDVLLDILERPCLACMPEPKYFHLDSYLSNCTICSNAKWFALNRLVERNSEEEVLPLLIQVTSIKGHRISLVDPALESENMKCAAKIATHAFDILWKSCKEGFLNWYEEEFKVSTNGLPDAWIAKTMGWTTVYNEYVKSTNNPFWRFDDGDQ